MLLDEAEREFGYTIVRLLKLPCSVKLFQRVLCEVEQDTVELHSPRCNFAKVHAWGTVAMQTGPSEHLARMSTS
ncbi:hypothetical protein MUK42_12904 [Musa troglodytarum]|uniref:Uncharacterized protein n=1 Tax=Musa troglodytarum TaxID=320322 RepID=A0A9E7GQT1_9LILI|nr:hypothetical protein MUK42_12904 [Musa troglodytarum]